jgi:hypothetical protein
VKPVIQLGRVVATHGATQEFSQAEMLKCLDRHHSGDWGDLDIDDKAANELAVESGEDRILSCYKLDGREVALWIITEADRSVTTLLLPSEY